MGIKQERTEKYYEKHLPRTSKVIREFFASGHREYPHVTFSPKTVHAYETEFHQFFSWFKKEFSHVTENDVNDYLTFIREKKEKQGKPMGNISMKINSLKSLFRWAKNRRIIKQNPTVEIKAARRKAEHDRFLKIRQSVLSIEESERLVQSAQTPMESAILSLFVSCGCRLGELLHLHFEDVDLDGGTIIFDGKTGKRLFDSMSPKLIRRLSIYKIVRGNIDSPYFFTNRKGQPLDEATVRKIVQDNLKRAGINKKIRVHDLRHSFVTNALASGVPSSEVQRRAGHADLKTTELYSHYVLSQSKFKEKFPDI